MRWLERWLYSSYTQAHSIIPVDLESLTTLEQPHCYDTNMYTRTLLQAVYSSFFFVSYCCYTAVNKGWGRPPPCTWGDTRPQSSSWPREVAYISRDTYLVRVPGMSLSPPAMYPTMRFRSSAFPPSPHQTRRNLPQPQPPVAVYTYEPSILSSLLAPRPSASRI